MMESVKKWLSERTAKKNGLYVHHSPPRILGVASAAQLRQWARAGAESKLERAILAGQGRRLLAEAEALPLSHHLLSLIAKCDAFHAAVERGSLLELQELLEPDYNRRKYVMCCDEVGVGLLHKAVYYDYVDIATWLVKNYPDLVHQKDSEGRTPLHYAAVCREEAAVAALLEGGGAARGARDAAGHTPSYYRGPARALLVLPTTADMARETKNRPGLVIKRHNIRIWCHDVDMARLQRVVWEGHGTRLLSEVSNQPVVRKFLEAVPYIMNTIRDIHSSVAQNDLEGLMKLSGDPVPPQALSSRDGNNLTVLHKAAGLGHGGILNYIVDRYPQGINDVDNDGRTPLHYAAAVRDDRHTYNTLVSLGADEGAVDNKNRTPGYYINRPQDIDKNVFKALPEAPRTASSAYPSSWDWKLLDTEVIADLNKKSRKKNLKASSENISSKNNTNTISESTDNKPGVIKPSSTHEFIKDLPELDDTSKRNGNHIESNKEAEIAESNGFDENTEKEEDNDVEPEEPMKNDAEQEDNANETAHTVVEPTENTQKEFENHLNNSVATEEPPVPESTNKDDIENKDDEIENKHDEIENTQVTEVQENEEKENNLEKKDTENEIINESQNIKTSIENKQENSEIKSRIEDNHSLENEEEVQQEKLSAEIEDTKDENSHDNKQENAHDDQKDISKEENNDPQHKLAKDSKENDKQNTEESLGEKTVNNNTKVEEDSDVIINEGNNSSDHNEDDDDVKVQGDADSENNEFNVKRTAEISDSESAKRDHTEISSGNLNNGRNTQESLIEGIISGEAEQDSQDASITQREESVHGEMVIVDNEIDPEVTDLINNANMEMLATLVLNGEGSRLIGRRSGNSELQSFLDNVPTYMQKINKVHLAAREGNIRDLQTALDRRKFAIARDPISPNGATPLHVATVFGKTNIMKYLGGRFPETLSAVDFEGRTALHYAAVLPDNGYYYNLLQQLGANSKDLDDSGRSAEDNYQNPGLLPFNQLLSEYGISEEAMQEMFSDKGTTLADNGHMDIPIFRTEEGRYLSKSLGDPLIKGLTEVANIKPKDPVAFLASFLHNFPEGEKPELGTQESNVIETHEAGEVENDQPPPPAQPPPVLTQMSKGVRSGSRTATRPHRPIDVVTVDPQALNSPDAPEVAFSSVNRDEHGQSMLHFAAARTHARNALFQLLQESDISLGYRDELYRTARDVSIQANVPENTAEIDKWVLHLAARGHTDKIMELMLEGYDHILDVVDEEGVPITDVILQRGDSEMSNLLASIPAFEESRETLHAAVRRGDLAAVKESIEAEGGRTLARSQNSFGRTSLHVAVLAQHEDVVACLAQTCPELLRVGDNLERTSLHYAMGVEKVESLSRVLIRSGAKRVLKDLKGRQPTYYFMNKSDILRLKEEEDVY